MAEPPHRQHAGGGDSLFHRLGDLIARYHWIVIGLWVLGLVLAVPGIRNLSSSLVTGGFEVAHSESGRGTAILEQEFDERTVATAVLVFTSNRLAIDDPNDATFHDAVARSIDRVKAMPEVKSVVSFLSTEDRRFVSDDGKTTYAVMEFAVGEEEAKEATPHVREQLVDQPEGIRGHLLGFTPLAYDLAEDSDHDLEKAELYSLPLSLLLLVLVFGTILAAGLPLILAIFAVGTAFACIYLVAQQVETSIFAKNTASMIGLGLGIDFSLLMVSRFREELDKGLSSHQATVNTVATAGRSIVFSAITVMLGLGVLLLYKLTLVRSIAIGMLLVAFTAMLAAITLLPALMALFGRKINALRLVPGKRGGPARHGGGRWHNWSLLVMRSPWAFLIPTVALLLALAWPVRELNAIGTGSARTMPEESKSRQAFEALVAGFGEGEATPIPILIKSSRENGAWDPTTLEGVYQLTKQLEADPRVERVESLVTLANRVVPNISEAQFKTLTREHLQGDPRATGFLPNLVNVDRSSNSHAVRVVSKQDELGADSINLVKDIREDIIPSIPAFDNPALRDRCTDREPAVCTGVYVAGETALTLDYRDELLNQFPQLVGLVLVVTYVVLLLFFHSLIMPLKAILMNIAAILASYGVLVLVFQHGVGEKLLGFEHLDRLSMFSPVILFSILFGLSTDYEVFLLSRVRELYAHSGDNEQSVAIGLERTAGIITAAGLIMIVVFGSFALGSTMVIKELGVGLAVAVLLDSTIIRIVMVPASMKLMGAGNWWMPKFLDWIPQIKESAEEEPMPAAVGAQAPARVAEGGGGGTYRPCPVCGSPRRASARFCGVCGSRLPAPGAATATGIQVTGGETMVDWQPAPPGARAPAPAGGPLAGGSGVRRVPIMLTNGRQQQQAWLVLRDCQVEDNPQRRGVPLLHIQGLDLAALAGSEPEIQIRNARVRM